MAGMRRKGSHTRALSEKQGNYFSPHPQQISPQSLLAQSWTSMWNQWWGWDNTNSVRLSPKSQSQLTSPQAPELCWSSRGCPIKVMVVSKGLGAGFGKAFTVPIRLSCCENQSPPTSRRTPGPQDLGLLAWRATFGRLLTPSVRSRALGGESRDSVSLWLRTIAVPQLVCEQNKIPGSPLMNT